MRPVQLQLNNSGSWKTVARWDATDDEASGSVQEAVAQLGTVNPNYTWRIATQADHPVVLRRWSSELGWKDAS